MKPRISILGDGGWGTALALVLARKGVACHLWSAFPDYAEEMRRTRTNRKYLPGFELPASIDILDDLEKALHADYVVIVVPTVHLRSVLERMKSYQSQHRIIISGTKGIENSSLLRPSQIIQNYFPAAPIAVLSGPSHAEEVAHAIPTCVVASSTIRDAAHTVQELFMESRFRVYSSDDVCGVELGGAVKNVIALAAGICDGLGFGSNTKAALLSRGLQEIMRLGVALGARAETFFGLSGLGDLVTTCVSQYGRNRAVGERLAKGETLEQILSSMVMVAEGVPTTKSAYELARAEQIDMPITNEVYAILYEKKDPLRSISDLMMRDSKHEMS